jgi:hypothetical protein
MSKFNESTVGTTKTRNLAGGEAYTQSVELEIVSILLTSFVEDKFYSKASDQTKRLKELLKYNPLFAAKAAIYARNEFGMRSISHVAASELARHATGKRWAQNFYREVIRRPDDMTEILAYHLAKNGKLSNAMKKGFSEAFAKFDAYQLAKWRSEGKSVSLLDVARLVHPVPTDRNAEALAGLAAGTLKNTRTWEAKLSDAGKTEGSKSEAKAKAWSEVIETLGYMALLKNLRNIEQDAPELIDRASQLLVNPVAIRKSLVLPFRFYDAVSAVSSRQFKIALSKAADLSVENVPNLKGKTLIAVDVSGSMRGQPEKIAKMFGSILFKALDSEMIMFQSDAEYANLNPADSVFSLMDGMRFSYGGTNFHSIFDRAKGKYDRIIILSDMQGWMSPTYSYGYRSSGKLNDTFANYKRRTGANPLVYSFDLAGHGSMQFPERGVVALAGFSDKVFELIDILEKDRKVLVKRINEIKL